MPAQHIEVHVDCPKCGGHGEVQHPDFGARFCPEPSTPCPACRGNGHVVRWLPPDEAEAVAPQQAALARLHDVPPATRED